MNRFKKTLIAVSTLAFLGLAACQRQADVASYNLSYDADNFQIMRRIVFFNGITDKYLLEITGLCSLGNNDKPKEVTVTCKTGNNKYVKHFLGLSDNVSYFAEQVEGADVSTFHYEVAFRPQTILPDIDFQGDAHDLTRNRN